MPHYNVGNLGETSIMDLHNFFVKFEHIASGNTCKFYAILDNFQDTFSPKWNEMSAYGRMDPISTFQGTQRQIQIGFSVVSEDEFVGYANMQEVNKLINFLYPSYEGTSDFLGHPSHFDSVGTLTAAPLLRMQFINLVSDAYIDQIDLGLAGYISSPLSVNPVIEDGWIPGTRRPDPLDEPTIDPTPRGILIPRTIKLSFNYRVLHSHPLGWDGAKTRTSGYFPYPGGHRFLDSGKDEGGWGRPAIDPDLTAPITSNDEVPDEILESRTGDPLAGVGGRVGARRADNTTSHDEARRGRTEASDPKRSSTRKTNNIQSDSSNREIDEFYKYEI